MRNAVKSIALVLAVLLLFAAATPAQAGLPVYGVDYYAYGAYARLNTGGRVFLVWIVILDPVTGEEFPLDPMPLIYEHDWRP